MCRVAGNWWMWFTLVNWKNVSNSLCEFCPPTFFEFLTSKQSGAGISNFQFFLQSKLKWWQIKRDGKNLKKKNKKEKSQTWPVVVQVSKSTVSTMIKVKKPHIPIHTHYPRLLVLPARCLPLYSPPPQFLPELLPDTHTDRLEAEFRDTHYYYYYTESSTNGTSFCLQLGPNHFCQ